MSFTISDSYLTWIPGEVKCTGLPLLIGGEQRTLTSPVAFIQHSYIMCAYPPKDSEVKSRQVHGQYCISITSSMYFFISLTISPWDALGVWCLVRPLILSSVYGRSCTLTPPAFCQISSYSTNTPETAFDSHRSLSEGVGVVGVEVDVYSMLIRIGWGYVNDRERQESAKRLWTESHIGLCEHLKRMNSTWLINRTDFKQSLIASLRIKKIIGRTKEGLGERCI